MPTAIVTQLNGHVVQVRLASETTDTTAPAALESTATETEAVATEAGATETTAATTAPNPIAATPNELAWTAGSFLVLFVIMRYFLFPRLKKATDARYASIRANVEGADQVKSDARSAVAEYEAALAAVHAEAAGRIDAARQTLDNERTAQLAQVNARIAAARAEAEAATAQARAAAQSQIATAVATVVTRAAELATGRKPDASTVDATVKSVMESAVTR